MSTSVSSGELPDLGEEMLDQIELDASGESSVVLSSVTVRMLVAMARKSPDLGEVVSVDSLGHKRHAIRLKIGTRGVPDAVLGCVCGWVVGGGAGDAEDQFAAHLASELFHPGRSR
jgi:hypothetical protein